MPRGRNYFGPGFWWRGIYSASKRSGWGGGNLYPFCRNFPWLPRGWWAYGGGFNPGYWNPSVGSYPHSMNDPYIGLQPGEQEINYLRRQADLLQQELRNVESRISNLESEKPE